MKRIFIISCLALIGYQAMAQESQPVKKVVYPEGYQAQIDVIYTKVDNWDGKMDLYTPAKGQEASPIVINIHGGGWNKGNKESQTGFSGFFKKGYAVANVAYRLSQVASAPAAVEDIRCALIYLITNAEALHIDPNKIVIMGGSAGAHLALMGGLLENDHRFDTHCKTTKTVKVAAIIDQYGITDVWDWGYGPHKTSKSAALWLGDHAKDRSFAASVSPITYVKKSSPPTFIVHGDADPVVPYEQSEALYKKFQEMGVQSQFVTVPGGEHGKFEQEKKKEVNAQIMAFLKALGIHK